MKPSRFILVLCFLIHVQMLVGNLWMSMATYEKRPYFWSVFQGVLYLSYPLMGIVTELLLNKLRVVQCTFVLYFLSSIFALIISVIGSMQLKMFENFIDSAIAIYVIVAVIGLGIYEANAIQFGMDQMQEAPSEQLSSYIHWYYWCINVGGLIMYYVAVGVIYHVLNCNVHFQESTVYPELLHYSTFIATLTVLIASCIQVPLSASGIVLCFYYSKCHHIEHTSRKPLKLIYQVLRYTYHHKYPERRSAFTYWENDMPSRINLGMEKYGGPFTYEQVEDVKTVLKLLLVILSLYGLQISGDGYSAIFYTIQTTGCPTFFEVMAFLVNPQHLTFIVAIVGIPFMKLLKIVAKCRINLSMLQRIQIGLIFALANEAIQCLYSAALIPKAFNCIEAPNYNHDELKAPLILCAAANTHVFIGNSSLCQNLCSSPPTHSIPIYLLVLILFLQGVSHLLVFATMLEFICAQCPNETKGLLIGVWYAMLSLKSFCINITDTQIPMDLFYWNIYHGIKGVGIFSSIVMFSMVCKFYNYRQRNEIVNEQAIIEAQYERELLLNSSTTDSDTDDSI